jgi:hypothetical protein
MREQTNRLQVPEAHRGQGRGSWQRLLVNWRVGALARPLECLDGDGLVLAFVVQGE